jgi:Kdo2-lipid IVA lauroyltransferase/acyltransferase
MSSVLSRFLYYSMVLPISYLPFRLLYFISDVLYLFTYYVVRYRRKVVHSNLANSFPELSVEEIIKIEKGFYKHFTDFLVESIKSITISEKNIKERCAIINPELPFQLFEEKKDIIVLCGHYNNWEYYAVGLAQQMKHKTIAAYRPLKNTYFNRLILKSRQRFGIKMISMNEVPRFFADKERKEPTMAIMVNDQSPGNPKKAHWNKFLNQDTGWMSGTEKLATKYDQAVLFGCIRKKKRGFYEVTFYPITTEATKVHEGFILDKHTEYLEMVIRENPQYWLWSHKRWKHKRP